MMIVVAVVSALAAVTIPRFVAMKSGQDARDLASALVRIGADARLLAIDSGQTVQVTYDALRRAVVFEALDPETLEGTEVKTIEIPEGVELSAFTLEGRFATEGDWLLSFYPDGSGSDAGIEVEDGLDAYHVLIEGRDGTATRAEGRLEEADLQEWQAGELEQRV
jgi:type II secretory pathway pseudopilin PulG